MQSPKFQFLKAELDSVFDISILKEEWKKRVRAQIRKQLIFDAIEYRDLNDKLDQMVSQTRRSVLNGSYRVRAPKRYLAEKSRGLCRQMTLVHPFDLLVLERLSRSVYFELKSKAPSKSAFFEPDDGSFVKGFKQADFEYGSFASWKKFQKVVFGFADENQFIVITDVANFYDFINFQHLRNIVASLADIREATLDLLIHVLNRLTWTPDFMPLTQVGMPQIETSATRVLANAMLYEVDEICENAAISNYARFMDDMDVGVESISAAKCVIRDIDLTLQSRQLRLNSSKTKILKRRDAYLHFCIDENLELARIDVLIEKKFLIPFLAKILDAKYENWVRRTSKGGIGEDSPFRRGNGSKIHKYILSLIYEVGSSVPDEDLRWLIEFEPGMRSTAFRYLANSTRNNSNLNFLLKLIRRGTFVDDASMVELTGFLLHGRLRRTSKCEREVEEICENFSQKSDVGLHSATFLASKFLPRSKLYRLLLRERERICTDFWLARAAAGVAPRFIGTGKDWSDYQNLIVSLDNEDAMDVLNYLLDIASSSKFSGSLKSYINAINRSFPQSVYFPKVLILLAASKNVNISTLVPDMFLTHPSLQKDPHFKAMGF